MPLFKYTVRDKTGQRHDGEREAADRAALIRDLRQDDLFPIIVDESASLLKKPALPRFASLNRDVVPFTRQLTNLLISGVVLPRALNFLVKQYKTSRLGEPLAKIRNDVVGGKSFAEALAQFPQIFSRFYVSMIKAGEASGSLEQVMAGLTEYVEHKKSLQETIVSLLIYPLILLVVGLGSIVFLLTAVIPKMMFIFQDMGSSLPFSTRMLIAVSRFLSENGALLVIVLVVVGLGIRQALTRPEARARKDALLLKLPLLGDKLTKIIFVRFAKVLGLVLSSGVSLLDGLILSREVVQNAEVSRCLEDVSKKVNQGRSLSESLRDVGVFPEIYVNMISVGEETGRLDEILTTAARIYEQEVKEETRRLITLLEPSMIVLLAVAIGFLVMAMLLPVFQMNLLLS